MSRVGVHKLAEGVAREVFEETGLIVSPDQPVEIFERIMRDADGKAEYHYVLVDYICRLAGGSLAAADDVADVRWTSKQDLYGIRLTEGTLTVTAKNVGGVWRIVSGRRPEPEPAPASEWAYPPSSWSSRTY